MPLTIKKIWYLGEKENKEADRTISEEEIYKYTGHIIENKIPLIEINKKDDEKLVIEASKEHEIVTVMGPDYSVPKIIADENLIAETMKYNTKLFAFAKNSEELSSALNVLGIGMNVIVQDPKQNEFSLSCKFPFSSKGTAFASFVPKLMGKYRIRPPFCQEKAIYHKFAVRLGCFFCASKHNRFCG